MNKFRICIVGGSITGCTTAIAALKHGMEPYVFEKSAGIMKERGAGLGLPSGVAIDLMEQELISSDFPHVSIRSLVHSTVCENNAKWGGSAGEIPTYLEGVRWGHLYSHLRGLVPDDKYHTGVGVEDVKNQQNCVTVSFDDGRIENFDLAVFADGYRSLGRKIVSPDTQPQYQGYFLWRGVVSEAGLNDAHVFEQKLQRVGYPGGHFFAYLLPNVNGSVKPGERELNWGMFLPVSKQQLDEYLLDRNGDQRSLSLSPGAIRPELESTLKHEAKTKLPAYFADLVSQTQNTFGQGIVATTPGAYFSGRICLAGDAGAVLPPYTTSGVFKGMRNAVDLVDALAANEKLENALISWGEDQHRSGVALERLADVMHQRLIDQVPDFAGMTQDELSRWWTVVQTALEEVMG
ncbi:MAG: FAD-dependent monooxygenase [Pseudomonadota bacterium]